MTAAAFQPGDAVDVRVATPDGPVWRPAVVVAGFMHDGRGGEPEQCFDLRYTDCVGALFACDPSSIRPALPVRL